MHVSFAGRTRGVVSILWLVWVSCALLGCKSETPAPPIGNVSGIVTLNGQPVASGEILMVSDEGYAFSAPLMSDGSFRVVSEFGDGIPLGEYKVAITPTPAQQVPGVDPPTGDSPGDSQIPAKYRDLSTSGFTAKVESENPQFTFNMQP